MKLHPSPQVHASLLSTLRVSNEAADYASRICHEEKTSNALRLQKLVYAELKSRGLSSQPSLLVISKVAGAYSSLKANLQAGHCGKVKSRRRTRVESTPVTFRRTAAQPFDDRCLSWNHERQTVSIWTVDGRIKGIPFTGDPAQLAQIAAHRKGQTDLILKGGSFYLAATIDLPEPPLNLSPNGFLGVDMGTTNLATLCDGTNWSGGAVTATRKKHNRLRARVQAKGTKGAKRLLKKRSKRESRYVTEVNHRVSKEIVAEAKRTGRGIAIENLVGIRERVRLRKPQRATFYTWAFAQLGAFLIYKAQAAGIPIFAVDPAYSSQECSFCGHTEKKNRKKRDIFKCLSCGVSLDADVNAARNLARRGDLAWVKINRPTTA